MPFGLKNTGATYQSHVNAIFRDQFGKTIVVYIDNMVVKIQMGTDHVHHLEEIFMILKKY